jgi:hypothetical protein
VASDFLRLSAEKVFFKRFPQAAIGCPPFGGIFAPTFSIFTHSGYTFAPVRTNDT